MSTFGRWHANICSYSLTGIPRNLWQNAHPFKDFFPATQHENIKESRISRELKVSFFLQTMILPNLKVYYFFAGGKHQIERSIICPFRFSLPFLLIL